VPVKVSVVVAVYNPGSNIDGLVSSLDAQSLGPDDLEVVFVDDGSTDGTHERLIEVARSRPNIVVTTIPNSGWPGRPRNVGTDLAHGEYVFYADHDDEIFPEALERMYAMAKTNGSDIVYGKIVRSGRSTPYWSLANANLENADVMQAVASRTVHKLYRREFLHEHRIRFPEGRVRLEDHNFMAQAIPRAKVISVLADYPCYRWIHRRDGTNSSDAEIDRRVYWGYYAGVLRMMEATSGPGPLLDATRVTAIVQAFSRIPPQRYLQLDPSAQAANFDSLHELVLEQLRPELDERIPVLKRLRVQALRSGDQTRFEHLQRCRTRMRVGLGSTHVALEDGQVLVGVDASLTNTKDEPMAMERLGEELVLPAELGAPQQASAAPFVLTTTERGTGEITIRHRQIGIEWPVKSIAHLKAVPAGNKATLAVHVDGTLDQVRSIFGRELEAGIWDVLVRVQFLGDHYVRRVPVDAETPLPRGARQVENRQVLVYRTTSGSLALKISAPAPPPVDVLAAQWEADHLVVALDVPVSGPGRQLVVRQRGTDIEQLVAVKDGQARIVLGHSVRGDIFDFWLRTPADPDGHQDQRLAFGAATVSQRPPYQIYDTIHGFFSVKHVDPSDTVRRTPAPIRRVRRWLSRRGGSS